MAEELIVTEYSTIPEVLRERIRLTPNQEVLVLEDDRVTFRDLGERIKRMAAVFQELGIKPGERIALLLPNNIRFTVVTYAVIEVGAVVVAVNPTYKPNEIKQVITDSEANTVVVAEKFPGADPLGKLKAIQPDLPFLKHILVDGDIRDYGINLEERLKVVQIQERYHQAGSSDLAALLYTSGTTGAPKGSMHTHRSILFPLTIDILKKPTIGQMFTMIKRFGFGYLLRLLKVFGKPIRVLITTPPYAGAGLTGTFNLVLSGRTIILQERFSTSEAIKLVEKEKVSVFGAVPALAALFLRDPELKNHDVSSLIYIAAGAAFVSPGLVAEIKEKLGCPTMIAYGATELIGVPTQTNPFTDSDTALRETVGKVSEGYEVKIVDEQRQEVPPGTVGEIAVRGASLMLGYFKAEDLTSQVIDEDRWYYTGDLGSLDEEGYLRIAGRIKDLIIRAGQNIYPAELEKSLVNHPKIHTVSIVGVPDDMSGEKVVAFIIPKAGSDLTELEVRDYCIENLAPYKIPRDIYFVDDLPMTPTGKVLKRVLREQVLAKLSNAD
jgi:acyl-CoA synthetase (AMP-forming)/AMP-acid ligase II